MLTYSTTALTDSMCMAVCFGQYNPPAGIFYMTVYIRYICPLVLFMEFSTTAFFVYILTVYMFTSTVYGLFYYSVFCVKHQTFAL